MLTLSPWDGQGCEQSPTIMVISGQVGAIGPSRGSQLPPQRPGPGEAPPADQVAVRLRLVEHHDHDCLLPASG
jgi:hypothetical protein